MKLHAISDLHLGSPVNRAALEALAPHRHDWLILAGDIGETEQHLRFALETLTPRFAQVIWVPGNHDLWTIDPDPWPLKGEYKYRRLVEVCRSFGALTPEDPYVSWPGAEGGQETVIAPMFLLYDYSFRPDHVALEDAVAWARDGGAVCGDEGLLEPEPHHTCQAWCERRVLLTERRLADAAADGRRLVLVNHFPLRRDLIALERTPRFSIWCGTRATENWHLRFNAEAVVYGHLHLPGSRMLDGVRFEEVSLGYPGEWDRAAGVGARLRQILPAPALAV
ncbi:MAG: metallophosphoesterase family protein [Hyphomicrobiales bacterium]